MIDIELLNRIEQELQLKKEMRKKATEQKQLINARLEELSKINDATLTEMSNAEKALKFLKKLKIDKRDYDSDAITKALNSIIKQLFPNEKLRFSIKSRVKGEHTYAKLNYYKGNSEKPRLIKYCSGHGLRQAVSFTGVYTLLALSDNTPTIFLDECFRALSPTESELISQVLNHLTDLGFQLIIIEHNEHIFKHLNEYATYKLEKVYENDTEYTIIKDYIVGVHENG
ncbi:hypothetical protein [Clostridium tertium]|uniref:hypothetical protein n=1 Tax=Clostridium tertium TaxID=1559 RepID=UPI0023B28255|nr:hypothetical protein [Clostridium tertium]